MIKIIEEVCLYSNQKIFNLTNILIIYLQEIIKKESFNFIVKPHNQDMFLQKTRKNVLRAIDDKQCFLIEFEVIPWN